MTKLVDKVLRPKRPAVASDTPEGGKTPTLTVACPQLLLDEIDAYAKWQTDQRYGEHVGRAQATRDLLTEALKAWRAELKGTTK